MRHQIIIVDEPMIADLVEYSIHHHLSREYDILKAASGTELFHWLGLTVPISVNSILLGLSDAENRDVIDRLTQWSMRDDYRIVLLGENGYVQQQQGYLKANAAIEKWPRFEQDELCRVIRRFDRVMQLV